MLHKIPHLDNRLFLTIVVACLAFILILWYDSSPASFNSYQTICSSNYGKPEEFADCMKPFYNQQSMDNIGIIGALVILFLSSLTFVLQKLRIK